MAAIVGGVGVLLGATIVALWKGGVQRRDDHDDARAAMLLTSAASEIERLNAIIAAARRLTGEEPVGAMLDRAKR
jgi:tagatose-1,6-bisphosphate aldolase